MKEILEIIKTMGKTIKLHQISINDLFAMIKGHNNFNKEANETFEDIEKRLKKLEDL